MENLSEKDSKTRIFEVGTRLFAQKGYYGVSIRELAVSANVNSALISYYFGGKEGLYAAILASQFEPIEKLIELIKTKSLDTKEKIEFYSRAFTSVHSKNPYLIQFMFSELTNPTIYFEKIVKKNIALIYNYLHAAIVEGIQNGELKDNLNPQYATIALAGIMNFYFIAQPLFKQFIDINKLQEDSYAVDALNIYIKGVGKDES